MKDSKTLALIGAALLFIGAFMPIVSMPIMDSMNYFQNGRGDGVIIVVLAVVTAVLAATGHVRHVLWTGLAALGMLGFTFFRFESALDEAKAKMSTDLADNPFRGLAEAAANSVQLQWGWAVLVLGAAIVVFAGWQARRTQQV